MSTPPSSSKDENKRKADNDSIANYVKETKRQSTGKEQKKSAMEKEVERIKESSKRCGQDPEEVLSPRKHPYRKSADGESVSPTRRRKADPIEESVSPTKKRGRPSKKEKHSSRKRNPSETSSDGDWDGHVRKFVPSQGCDWSTLGGMQQHIQRVRENVIAPLLNPTIFTNLSKNLGKSKGILFYGPPGTGKTLMARGLVGECKKFELDVTFYARKSADILSKFIGQGEKHLRELFEEARKNSPSVIFFDEIDGLAPVRSTKNDSSHSSIVSTLLALMDGMDDRGSVIIIGATNRPDSLDPALRRAGRFDFELEFKPPDINSRVDILKIHGPKSIPETFWHDIAQRTAGWTGADLEQLCSESAMISIRRNFPEMHIEGKEKLFKKANPDRGIPTEADFELALSKLNPSGARSNMFRPAQALHGPLWQLFQSNVNTIQHRLKKLIPSMFEVKKQAGLAEVQRTSFTWTHPFLMVSSREDYVTRFVAPEILHQLDHLPVFTIDIVTLVSDATFGDPKQYVSNVFRMAESRAPSVIYLPSLSSWHDFADMGLCLTLLSCLSNLRSGQPVCVLSTVDSAIDLKSLSDLKPFVKMAEQLELDIPSDEERKLFLRELLKDRAENFVEVRLRNQCFRLNEGLLEKQALERVEEMVDTESEVENNDSIDFTKELKIDVSIQTKVRTAIKTITSDLLNRLPKLTWPKLDNITKYVRDDKYHTFDSFLQDVQSLHIEDIIKDSKKRSDVYAWEYAAKQIKKVRAEMDEKKVLSNQYHYFKKLIKSADDHWFYRPLIASACAKASDGSPSPETIAYSNILQEFYPNFDELSKQIAANSVNYLSYTQMLNGSFDIDVNSFIPKSAREECANAIKLIKDTFGITTFDISEEDVEMVEQPIYKFEGKLLPNRIDEGLDEIVDLLLTDDEEKHLKHVFSAASTIEMVFDRSELFTSLDELIGHFLNQQQHTDYNLVARDFSLYIKDEENLSVLRDLFKNIYQTLDEDPTSGVSSPRSPAFKPVIRTRAQMAAESTSATIQK